VIGNGQDSKIMASNAIVTGTGDGGGGKQRPGQQGPVPPRKSDQGGFFTVYKKGQGKWTRLGTAAGAVLLIFSTASFVYTTIPVQFFQNTPEKPDNAALGQQIALGLALFVMLGLSLLAWRLMNKSPNAQFLVDTDGEMKKVNWSTRKELFGSTRVVILFMFVIAAFLFVVDIAFGYFFYLIDILYTPPF